MGTTIFLAAFIIVMNLVVDLCYKLVDPRINLVKEEIKVMSDKKRFNKPAHFSQISRIFCSGTICRQMHLIRATSEEKKTLFRTAEAYLTGKMHGDVFVKIQLRWWQW